MIRLPELPIRRFGWRVVMAAAFATACAGGPAPSGTPAPVAYTRSQIRTRIDSLISDPRFSNAMWGVVVVHPTTGDTLFSRNAGKMFMPASNMKLVTMAVALAHLGRDYRWRTIYGVRGQIRDSVLEGDLVVYGRGDPSISNRMRGDAMIPLRAIGDSLRAHGITAIRGRVVADGDAFPGSVIGSGWEWADLDGSSGAVVDELWINDGVSRVTVYGGAVPGAPLRVVTTPSSATPLVFVGGLTADSTTWLGTRRPAVQLTRIGLQDAFDLTGTLFPGDSAGFTVTLRDPPNAFLNALRGALMDRGITISAGTPPPEPLTADTIFATLSPPLDSVLAALGKPSQNQMAEVVFKTIGLEKAGLGRLDSARRVITTQLAAWGAAPTGAQIMDGSGLSRHDLLTPETIIRVLAAMKSSPDSLAFRDALPIAGIDGTIGSRMRQTAAQGNVRAKTGTLGGASSLSGYVTTADGEMLLFSILCNNFTTPTNAVTGVQDSIAAGLAQMRWRSR